MASAEEIEKEFIYTENFNVEDGLLIVESIERSVGYVLGRWNLELGGTYIYRHMGKLVPEFLRQGIGAGSGVTPKTCQPHANGVGRGLPER